MLARYLRWRGLQVRLVSNVTDIDDAIINRANREQRPWDDIAQKCERVWFNAMDGINVARPDDIPHATQYVDGDGGDDRRARGAREGVPHRGRRVPVGRDGRPITGCWPTRTSTSSSPAAATVRWSAPSTSGIPPTSSCGSSPSRASRRGRRRGATGGPGWHSECVVMSLDLLGEGFDLHCGGHGPAVPAPRERAGAGRRARQAVRQPLDAPRLHRRRRGREDVQEPGQRRQPARPDRAVRPPRRTGCSCCRATTAARSRSARRTCGPRNRRWPGWTRSPPGACVGAPGRPPIRRCSMRSVRRWTRISTLRRRWPCVFDTVRRANTAIDRGDTEAGPLVDAVREMTDAVGLELTVVGDRARRGAGAGGRPRRGPCREGLRPGRRHPQPRCTPTAGSSRRRRRDTVIRR